MKRLDWLLPNKHNKYHPHALRPVGLLLFLALFIGTQFTYNLTSANQMQVLGYATNVTLSDVYAISNQERANAGLPPLTLDGQLNNAAYAKANDMFAKNYWAHVAPDGTTPWTFISNAGYDYAVAGENLAKNFSTSAGVVAGWMGSATHRANVLGTEYRDVGYAVVNGVLLGSETTLVVAMYGARASAPVAAASPQQQAVSTTPEPAPTTPIQEAPAPEPETQAPVSETQKEEASSPTSTATTAQINKQKTEENGVVEGIMSSAPVKAYQTLNWGQKVSLVLLGTLLMLFIMKHTIIWREQKRGFRHIWLRAHPLGQASMLIVAIFITLVSGVGVVL